MSEFVELREGPTLPVPALALGCDLERRGMRLSVDGDKLRVSGPDGKPDLTGEDVEAIRRWKAHIIAAVTYQPPQQTATNSETKGV